MELWSRNPTEGLAHRVHVLPPDPMWERRKFNEKFGQTQPTWREDYCHVQILVVNVRLGWLMAATGFPVASIFILR